MTVTVASRVDNGDGTDTITARTPGGNYVTVTVGRDVVVSGAVYDVLAIAARRADAKAAGIAAHDAQPPGG